ncbi:hypothetical protein B1F73_21735 [Pseudomonas syringae]|jgi:hypothetical protein|uniref:Uncharacterized protein n=1 Tax=Pseudomonas syringae TaxID=317 RepID=A0AB37ZDU5_PSESX|nr:MULTISPECIES: DUF6527 family protein [Pseudomonas]MBI6666608.1 hypothetical protein [Pseudomonas syringae]MBI6679141.1 hypothetical protein [Pseudomonas syringae]MBI6839958.1 hypothetical protein [Pseudomonas syringae]NAP02802.1 hypothetical protein [Pseudomonas syringae]NAP18596.1 hypothetical protein [Pseudomonas syringae]
MTIKSLTPQFVESFPQKLEPGELYLAMDFATAAHLCACGCGNKVITPFSPTDWQMSFDGETVSLKPSIGNWTFKCRSHYWVRSGRIEWAGNMSQEAINAGRKRDAEAKARRQPFRPVDDPATRSAPSGQPVEAPSLISRLKSWLGL